MVLRVDLELYQWNSAKRQLTKFVSDFNDFLLPQCTKCAHILEDVQSASCDAARWFSGLIQIYIIEILLQDSWRSLHMIYNDFLHSQCIECAHILEDVQSASYGAATWFSGLI